MIVHYDPILCMNVPDKATTKDASWKAWTLYIDGKAIKQFTSEIPPIKEAREYIKANHPGKVGKLSRNTGSSSGYMVAANDNKTVDQAIKVADVKEEDKFIIHNATVRNDTLYITYEDKLYSPGKKEKMAFTKTEAKKLLTDPWNEWLGTSKMVVKQFVG